MIFFYGERRDKIIYFKNSGYIKIYRVVVVLLYGAIEKRWYDIFLSKIGSYV